MSLSKMEILRKIVAEKQAMKVTETINGKNRKILVDGFSASAIVQVYDALNDENKIKFSNLNVSKMAAIAFKFVK